MIQEAQLSQRPRDTSCHWIFCLVTRGHSKWHCWVGCVLVPISIFIETACMLYHFWDIQHQKNGMTLKLGVGVVQSHWKWSRSIDHTTLLVGHCKNSCILYHFQVIWRWIIVTLKRSLKVIQTGTIRKLGCGCLFAFHSNYGCIFNCSWDIQRQRKLG